MGNELAVIQAAEWEVLTAQAKALVQSGFLPKGVDTPQKAVAIIMLGRELGIAPWASMSSINVIQGKPSVSPQLMLALINRSGQLENMLVNGDERQCSVTMKRKGRAPHTESFSIDEARKMNVTNKPTWQSIPGTMLKWRAVAACARVVFPDVILGLYTPDEMGADVAVDETGNMEVIHVSTPEIPRLVERPTPTDENPLEWHENGMEDEIPTAPARQAPAPASVSTPPPADTDTLTAGLGATVTRIEDAPLPRNSDGLPILGILDMGALLRLSFEAGDVTGKHHFANLIDLLYREGSIRDASTADGVLDAIRKHAAEKVRVS